ncbi:cytidine deaminase family protein [Enterococcus sp. AZ194]|uniref:cytidine deaminase family protein n=1 Tax=Enterococcus sp. AZ194 TaxID=2774629 RepID=UPI003F682E66
MEKTLYELAKEHINYKKLGENGESGHVSCALLTEKGNIYTGISIDLPCSIGFCAEHAAIASMIDHDETVIKEIVAVHMNGEIYSPCGRCREMIHQIDEKNKSTKVWLTPEKKLELHELLPYMWDR